MLAQPAAIPPRNQGFWQVQTGQIPPVLEKNSNNKGPENPMMSQMMSMLKQQKIQINQINQALQVLASNETQTI